MPYKKAEKTVTKYLSAGTLPYYDKPVEIKNLNQGKIRRVLKELREFKRAINISLRRASDSNNHQLTWHLNRTLRYTIKHIREFAKMLEK